MIPIDLAELGMTLFEESGDALFLFDPDTEQLLEVNPMALRLCGFPRAELLRRPVSYLFRSEVQGGLQRLRHAYRHTGVFHSQEGFLLRHQKEGVWVPVNLTVARLHAEPQTLGLITARDVRERREAQALLQTKEAELRHVIASVSDCLWSTEIDAAGRWTSRYISPVIERLTGRPAAFYQSGPDAWLNVVHPEDRPQVEAIVARLRAGQSVGEEEYRIVCPDGTVRWLRDSIRVSRDEARGVLRLDGVLTDITQRKRAEAVLAAEKHMLELISTRAPLPHILEELCRCLEEQAEGMLGSVLLLEEDGKHLRLAAGPSLPAAYSAAVARIPVGPDVGSCGTAAYRRAPVIVSDITTDPLWADYRDRALAHGLRACWSTPILSSAGQLLGTFAMYYCEPRSPGPYEFHLLERATHLAGIAVERARAEAARRQHEERVRHSEAKYRSLIENLEQCIFLKDADFRFVAVNRPFCQSLDQPESAILGKTDFDFYPPNLAEKYRADDRRVLAEGTRLELEEQNLTGDRLRTVRVVKTPVRDEEGRPVGVLGIFWDVTEQRALEAQLRQAQKMEAVGQLAGGVAHDFNNLLTIILGNISLVAVNLAPGDPNRPLVAAAESAALRAAAVTRQMLGFARRMAMRTQSVSLNLVIDEVVGLLRSGLDPRIAVEVHKAPELWPVQADPGQMNQVLMNLVLNARDALPAGGRIRIETANVILGEDYTRRHLDARPGEFVRLRVSDTGHGIPADILPRIFDPFFTTKEPGKGTGLGLAVVFGIVKSHQGWIDCASEVDRGACFDIYLPRSVEGAAADRPAGAGAALPGHGETVLLVDDEPLLREFGREVLQRHGYQVLLAEDGLKAVEVYRREHARIDLVVLDLTMPGLSGRDAYRQMVQINPAAPVLFASGYSVEEVLPGDRERGLGFLSKPYRPEELAQAVRAALDRRRGPAGPATARGPAHGLHSGGKAD